MKKVLLIVVFLVICIFSSFINPDTASASCSIITGTPQCPRGQIRCNLNTTVYCCTQIAGGNSCSQVPGSNQATIPPSPTSCEVKTSNFCVNSRPLECSVGTTNYCCVNIATCNAISGTSHGSGAPNNPLNIDGCDQNSLSTAIGCIPVLGLDNGASFLGFILKWAVGVGGGIAFLLILYSGFMIMTSSGNPERLKAGQELLTSAIAGIILLIFSIFLLKFIGLDILGLGNFGFGQFGQ